MMSYEFPWQAINVVAGGSSILDIDRLELKNDSEAYQFALNYGYDLYEPQHLEQLQLIYDRAAIFVQKYLCTEQMVFPSALKNLNLKNDVKTILLLASGVDLSVGDLNLSHRPWICALLRVMHASSHLQSDLRLKYIPKIKRQTVDRFQAHIQQSGSDVFLGFESDKVPLVAFQKKEGKVRDSVLMKLLHKPSATAQEVYDHLGVRFVTKNRVDALRVIKYLVDHHLVAFPNVLSVRCRNTLVDLQEFRKAFDAVHGNLDQLYSRQESLPYPQLGERENPFSSEQFRSIQFTARQLIRIPVVRKGGQKREMAFFFPVEVQIMDEAAFQESQSGRAGHQEYKLKQLEAVRRRILRGCGAGGAA